MGQKRIHGIGIATCVVFFCAVFPSEGAWSRRRQLNPPGDHPFGHAVAAEGQSVHVAWLGTLTDESGAAALFHRRSDDCGQTWEPPVTLARVDVAADEVALAVSGEQLHVVWVDSVELPSSVYHAASRDGGREWSEPLRISPRKQQAFQPSVAATADHAFVAYRAGPVDRGRVVLAASQDAGRSWSRTPATVRTAGLEATHPRLGLSETAAGGGLRLHLAWAASYPRTLEVNPEVRHQVSDDLGRSWFETARVSPEDDDPTPWPISGIDLVTLGPSVHVAWSREARDLEIRHARSVSGAFRSPRRLDAPGSRRRFNLGLYDQLALTGAGRVLHAAWVEYPTADRLATVLVARSGNMGRSWGAPKRLARGDTPGLAIATSAVAAATCPGNAHLVYRITGGGATPRLFYRRRPAQLP